MLYGFLSICTELPLKRPQKDLKQGLPLQLLGNLNVAIVKIQITLKTVQIISMLRRTLLMYSIILQKISPKINLLRILLRAPLI